MLDMVKFEVQIAVFLPPPRSHWVLGGNLTGEPINVWQAASCKINQWSTSWELIRAVYARFSHVWASKHPFSATFQSHWGLGRNWTRAPTYSPDCELQDTPIIRAIRGSDGCIYPVQSRLGVKTHHFDGFVRVSLMSLRIGRTTNESSTCTVFENTIKSEIEFILASLHHFWSNSCDFCSVRHLLCSWFLMLWKALNNLDNWY